jgi:hypothetical protein
MPKTLLDLGAPDVTTKIYRLVVNQLQTDRLLLSVVKNWQTWDGDPKDIVPPTISSAPWIGLTPRPVSETWYSPESQEGWLYIQVRALVKGTCVDDVMNLWGAIRGALSPRVADSAGIPFMKKLQDSGAPKGLVEMSQPISDPSPDPGQDGGFAAVGQLRILYLAMARS